MRVAQMKGRMGEAKERMEEGIERERERDGGGIARSDHRSQSGPACQAFRELNRSSSPDSSISQLC